MDEIFIFGRMINLKDLKSDLLKCHLIHCNFRYEECNNIQLNGLDEWRSTNNLIPNSIHMLYRIFSIIDEIYDQHIRYRCIGWHNTILELNDRYDCWDIDYIREKLTHEMSLITSNFDPFSFLF